MYFNLHNLYVYVFDFFKGKINKEAQFLLLLDAKSRQTITFDDLLYSLKGNNLHFSGDEQKKGSSTWHPNQKVVDALDDAFYRAFENVEPTGKKFYLGVDVSGSMNTPVLGSRLVY